MPLVGSVSPAFRRTFRTGCNQPSTATFNPRSQDVGDMSLGAAGGKGESHGAGPVGVRAR
jgi:hypothetical protein